MMPLAPLAICCQTMHLCKRRKAFGVLVVIEPIEELLEDHESYRKDFDELREEYESEGYDRFLVQLSWSDLPYRRATKEFIEKAGSIRTNPYVEAFIDQFAHIDTDRKACFLFPESYISQFFVIMEVCKEAESFYPVRNLFPDEEKIHYLAIFDKANIEAVAVYKTTSGVEKLNLSYNVKYDTNKEI